MDGTENIEVEPRPEGSDEKPKEPVAGKPAAEATLDIPEDVSLLTIRERVQAAIDKKYPAPENSWNYLKDLFATYAVFEIKGDGFACVSERYTHGIMLTISAQ